MLTAQVQLRLSDVLLVVDGLVQLLNVNVILVIAQPQLAGSKSVKVSNRK